MTGRVEARVAAEARRRVWTSNPSSLSLAVAVVRLARAVDAGRPGSARLLAAALNHLRDCAPNVDRLDEIRARAAWRRLQALETSPTPAADPAPTHREGDGPGARGQNPS